MIKVLHVWKDVNLFHGVHEQLLTLARYIDRNVFDLSICIFGNRCDHISSQFEDLNVQIYYLNIDHRESPMLLYRLTKVFRSVKPDIVQTYCLNPNIFGGIAARLAVRPSVISGELTGTDQAPSKIREFETRY